jgi:uncharacterized repeat protein (TIGR01451 family)
VACSFDPNDKAANPAGVGPLHLTLLHDTLEYTIRFQNTGTDTAFNIVLKDTLSNKLDWSSLQMVTASHNYHLNIEDGNNCTWYFNNILLADSNINNAASHGYVVYRIKPKPLLVPGDTIKNTAGIYFDYNLPVATNTEKTVIATQALPLKLLSFKAVKNGMINEVSWTTSNELNASHFEVVRSINGLDFIVIDKLPAANSGSYRLNDNNPANAINYYRLKMIDKDGRFEYSPVRMVNNLAAFSVAIFPNPVKDKLNLRIESDRKLDLLIEILSADGKVLVVQKQTFTGSSALKPLNLSSLKNGSYFIRVKSTSDQGVLKFEKL